MTVSVKRVSMDEEQLKSDHQQEAGAVAKRRRTEIKSFKVMSNSGSLVEPLSKRSRHCSGDVEPHSSSSVHVPAISSSSASSSIQSVVDHYPCHDDDDEGEGECIPLLQTDKVFETPISPSLQQDLISKGCGFKSNVLEARTRYIVNHKAVRWGSVSIRGMRAEMEDAMAVVHNFMSVACGPEKANTTSQLHFFGVYDGHGGPQAANFCRDRLHHALAEEFEVAMNGGSVNMENDCQGKWKKAFSDCFRKVDAEAAGGTFRRDSDGEAVIEECIRDPIVSETVGSTAVVAIVGPCQIIVSNCGDSRAVLSRSGRAIALSVDHKPDREDEMARIEAAGGKIINWKGYRVFGVLAMSRAIGDRYLKPSVIPDPDVTFTQRREEDECLIIASDGLWDVLSNEEVCRAARRCLAHGCYTGNANANANSSSSGNASARYPSSAQAAAEYLSRLALERNSSDNITVVVVDLKARRRRQTRS